MLRECSLKFCSFVCQNLRFRPPRKKNWNKEEASWVVTTHDTTHDAIQDTIQYI